MADYRLKIEAELEQISQAITKLPRCPLSGLSELELSGVGGILQSIYNGLENILKQLFLEHGKAVPDDPQWHQEILRRAVLYSFISEQTLHRLVPYLTFRHLYRNAYVLDLRPDMMQVLLDDIDTMFNEFKKDIS